MSDLAGFLAARLDEDEAHWLDEQADGMGADIPSMVGRMLREVAAKRAVLSEHPRVWPHPDGPRRCSRCVNTGVDGIMRLKEWPCPTVRALAAVYSDHEDYDQARE